VKTIISGSREITDPRIVEEAILRSKFHITEIVSGACRGVDQMGEDWARVNNLPVSKFPADWKTHGRAAGPMRNARMACYADSLIAVWDGKSRGTKNMIDLARQHGLQVYVQPVRL